MPDGLRELLGLPEAAPVAAATTGEFGQSFRTGIAELNKDMQFLAAHTGKADHQKLDSQRQGLIAAYHVASTLGNPDANQRVVAAAGKLKAATAAKVAGVVAGRDAWQMREAEFEAAVGKIGELEDAGDPKAPAYRKIADAIQNKANSRNYADASAAFDQLQQKLHGQITTRPVQVETRGNAPGGGAKAPGSGGSSDDARAQATKLRSAIEAQRKQSAEQLQRMREIEPVLKANVDYATGDRKKELVEKQAQLVKGIGEAEKAVARAKSDLEAIDNPGTKPEELLAILARQKAGGTVTEFTEITAVGLDPYKTGKLNKDVTTTTTSYADGQAKTESARSQQKVGLDGYTKTESRDRTVTDGHTTARSSHEKKTNLSLTGKVSVDVNQSIEVQKADGSKAALEVKKNKEISTKGASQTKTATVTKADGSSVSKTTKQEVERGDGQVTATTSSSVTKTNASGTATTTDKSASGGIVAGKDGIGVKGGIGGGKSVTSKKGRHAGGTVNIGGNVTCKIGAPKGDPKVYPVTVTVSFAASGSVSAGAGKKEGSKFSGSAELKGSKEGSMIVTHHYGEAELADYIKTLEAASKKGNKVAATQNEIAVISKGVNESWDAARQLWDALNKRGMGKGTTDGLNNVGDSAEFSETTTGGAAVKGKVGAVGAGYGKTYTDSSSRKATRNAQGGLDVDTKHEKGKQTDLSGSVDVGVVGLEVGKHEVHKTRFGYSIAIDPKNDPDGKILAALSKCKSKDDYAVFIVANHTKITIISTMEGQTDAEGTNVGASIGPLKGKIGTKQSVDKETIKDANGKVIGKKTTGSAGAGGELSSLADSLDEEAMAETDAEGNSSLTLSSTTKKNYGSRVRDKERKKLEEKLKGTGKASGALTDAAGGEDDTAVKDLRGLKLADKDLQRIGKLTQKATWMGLTRRRQEKEDWEKAWYAIKKGNGTPSVVAHELAKFIGGDRVERLETVRRIFRGGYKQTAGKAFEFPDSLSDIRADYDLVTDDGLSKKLYAMANEHGGTEAVKECVRLLAIVDRIMPRVEKNTDFDNESVRMEMVSALNLSRTMLNREAQVFSKKPTDNPKPEDDPKVLAEEGTRLVKLCHDYWAAQQKLVGELYELPDRPESNGEDRRKGRELIKQLEDLQYRWRSEWYRLKDNYEKRKLELPKFTVSKNVPQVYPNEALIPHYEKKFR